MITPIRLRLSNAYLVQGDRPILVDTGSPGDTPAILRALREHGVEPQDLALILHTHGHSDHCGSTADLRHLYPIPTAIHAADAHMLRAGRNDRLIPTSLSARLMRPLIKPTFPAVAADMLIEGELRLDPFGIAGGVIVTPGHTAGSVSVILDDGAAIVGDIMMGGALGGALFPGRPGYHYFAEDLRLVRASIKQLLSLALKVVYVGHGGPLRPEAIAKRFEKDF